MSLTLQNFPIAPVSSPVKKLTDEQRMLVRTIQECLQVQRQMTKENLCGGTEGEEG